MCVVLQHGGVTFLLMYTVMLGILGWPLLVLEAVLGQYSSLAPGHLYRHLCPLLAGLGLAVCLQAAVRALLDLGVLMWAALTCYALFSRQEIADGFFARDILAQVSNHLQICVISTYLYHIYTIYISTSLPRSSPRSASRAWASWAAAPSSCCPWSPWRVNIF